VKKVSYGKIFNYVCVVLMLLLLVTQFLPFWACENCEESPNGTASISDYVWFPGHHKSVNKVMNGIYGADFNLNDLVLTPVLILVSSVLTIVFCTIKAKNPLFGIIPFIGGVSGVVGYLTTPGLQAGNNWIIHLILAALVLVCSLVVLSSFVVKLVLKKKGFVVVDSIPSEKPAKQPQQRNPKYVNDALAWGLICATIAICVAIAMIVILPLL